MALTKNVGFSFAYNTITGGSHGADMNSILVHFQAATGTAWTSIAFSNTATPTLATAPTCKTTTYPTRSFEFDNVQWKKDASSTSLLAFIPFGSVQSPVVTPEPSSLLLLGTGLAGIGSLLRRKLPSQISADPL